MWSTGIMGEGGSLFKKFDGTEKWDRWKEERVYAFISYGSSGVS